MEEVIKEKDESKRRKRMKRIHSQIREQMEFYFSDSNLHRDRFIKQKMDENKDGYIPLDIFCKFNLIRQLTTDVKVISKALSKSELLEISEDMTCVRRTKPLAKPQDIDERTIYVENLPLSADHGWIKKTFSVYGKVLYVSLPRFKSTHDIRGFAFVEFETMASAHQANQELGMDHPSGPSSIQSFPKAGNKDMMRLQKQVTVATESNIDVHDEEINEQKMKRKRRNTSESSDKKEEVIPSKQRALGQEDKEESRKTVDADTKTNVLNEEVKPTKSSLRKRSLETNREVSRDVENVSITAIDSKSMITASKENDLKRKLPTEDKDENIQKDVKRVRINENVMVKEPPKQKRRRKKRDKAEEQKDVLVLRVLPKVEWLSLKNEYLSMQKENMRNLKKQLSDQKRRAKAIEEEADSKKKGSKPELTPGTVLSVKCSKDTSRKDLKARLNSITDIAYLDFPIEGKEGYIRCPDCNGADKLFKSNLEGVAVELLKGDAEKSYWEKIVIDWENKMSNKTKKKKGQHKVIKQAEKMATAKHVVFDD